MTVHSYSQIRSQPWQTIREEKTVDDTGATTHVIDAILHIDDLGPVLIFMVRRFGTRFPISHTRATTLHNPGRREYIATINQAAANTIQLSRMVRRALLPALREAIP